MNPVRLICIRIQMLASRMESTSIPDRIQLSRTTADHLIASGKEHWIKPRRDAVHAKGLGTLKTFWLQVGSKTANSNKSSADEIIPSEEVQVVETTDSDFMVQHQRNVDWIVDLLLSHARPMV
jgi:Adenylate and Guanylate cyclase catalytic domain